MSAIKSVFSVQRFSDFAVLTVGPLKVWLSMHVHPSERTDKAAFEIHSQVTVRVTLFDEKIYRAVVLEKRHLWGLCVRLGDEWTKKKTA